MRVSTLRILIPALLAVLLALQPSARTPSSTLTGRVVDQNKHAYFVTGDGHRYLIDNGAAAFLKYTNYSLEILDPRHPTTDTIRFTHYRILESDQGQTVDSSVRTILSVKNRRPRIDFQVQQIGPEIRFTLYLINQGSDPIHIRFASTQKYDFVVMTPDHQTTLWRWSWGRNFQVGFNDYVLLPGTETRFTEKWAFLGSYIEDGEYVAFAELHALPHGVISEQKSIIINADQQKTIPQAYFLPMKPGNTWVYTDTATGRQLDMTITGTIRRDGQEYFVFSFFPDRPPAPGTPADSRIIRFDRANSRFVEWTPQGEVALIEADANHRLIPSETACDTRVGRFDRCLEYRVRRERKWQPLFTIVPGIGVSDSQLTEPDKPEAHLELTEVRFANNNHTDSAAADTPDTQVQVTLRRAGGYPPADSLLSLRSNGTYVLLRHGRIDQQGTLPSAELWSLIQFMEREGLFQMRDQYGKEDVDNPLEIVLNVRYGERTKQIHMRTSATDKPPLAFWKIVDRIETVIRQSGRP